MYILYISNSSTFLHPHCRCPILGHHSSGVENTMVSLRVHLSSHLCHHQEGGDSGDGAWKCWPQDSRVHYCSGVSKAARDTAHQVKKESCKKVGRV